MNSEIRSYVSRYVVPIYYENENGVYEQIRDYFLNNTTDNQKLGLPKDGKWISVGFWENYKSDTEMQGEMDIYSYLQSIFLENHENKGDDKNLGLSFVYKTNGKLFELEYKSGEKTTHFECKDLGVVLLRNGVGFLWYEIVFKKSVSMSIEEYVSFQNDFKELARTHDEKFVKKVGFDSIRKEALYEPFCLGVWLSEVILYNNPGIKFWAERKKKREDREVPIPDKALMFQYMFVEQISNQTRNNLVFQIANGYDSKYNAPDNINDNLYKPFGNTCFYVSKAGMSCVVVNENTNEAFFDSQFRDRFVRDYFFIYMLLSYQSYSCALYSKRLAELPADEKTFNKNTTYIDTLESLNEQINLFLVKSVFESVSNIHHQNGVYRYGKAELCIDDDIQSLTIGLDALKNMEREKRDTKVNKALVVFGFMVVTSACIDGLSLVDWFINNRTGIKPGHFIVCACVVFLTLYLVINLLWDRRNK